MPRLAGEAKSYAERLFDYPIVDRLSYEDSCAALQNPARLEGAEFSEEALKAVYDYSHGYPYFLQVWGYHVWNQATGPCITAQDVEASASRIQARLDEGFFRVRFDRLTDAEKRYCRAMAELQEHECSTTRIAAMLQRKATSLASTRDRLVRKGMIYSSRQGVVSFTVPLFGDFLRRKMSLIS